MKRLLFGALCASILLVAAAVVPAATAGAAVPAPGVPTNVAVVAGGNQVTITWDAPTSGPTPTKYQVSGTSANPTCKVVLTTSCVITFPANKPTSTSGQVVKYKVKAYNGTKAGPNSPQVSALFGIPTVPTGVVATPGNGSVTISWNPSIGSKYPVSGYRVTASNGRQCTTVGPPTCTISALTNGQTLSFTVVANNAVGGSSPSAPAVMAVGAPLAPTGLVATAATASADIAFTAPADNGSSITSYTVTAHDVSNPGSPSDGFQWTGSGSPIHIPSLAAGHDYTFTLTASNANGEGPSSAPSNQVTIPGLAGAPTGVSAVAGVASASVSFTAPSSDGGSPIGYYIVTAYDQTNPSDPSNGTQWAGSSSPITKPGLVAGHSYTFTVAAVNGVGIGPDSASSSSVTIPSPPDAPTAVVATPGVNNASVAFTPGADNGSPIGYFIVTAYDQTNPSDPSNGTQWAGGGSPIVKSGLVSGHSYTFTVAAANGVGLSPESTPSAPVLVS